MKINIHDYRPDIDGLRALAVSLVVIFHAYPKFLTGGFIGVDVFFVISGYLITKIIATDLKHGIFSFRRFYEKRILRIFPALILVLLSCLVLGYFTLLAREYKPLGKHILGGAAYISNFILMKEAGYFDSSSELKALLHLWSLAIEEQFYLVWPVVLTLAVATRRNLHRVIGTAALLSFAICIYYSKQYPEAVFFNPVTRCWELFIGAFISFVPRVHAPNDPPLSGAGIGLTKLGISARMQQNLLSIVGFLLIAGSAVLFKPTDIFPYWRALLPCVGASLIILAGKDATVNRLLLSARPVVYVGLISYPLYLWHWPALYFARIISNDQMDAAVISSAILISLAAAAVTYHLVENHVRRSPSKFVPLALLVILIVIGLVGGLVNKAKGFPNRFPALEKVAKNVGSFDWYENGYDNDAACIKQLEDKFPDYCNMMDLKRPATIALLGDSTANHFFLGLADEITEHAQGENLVEIGKGGCPPLRDIDASRDTGMSHCDQTMADMLKYVKGAPSIHTVILSMTGATYMNETLSAVANKAAYYRVRSLSSPQLDDPDLIFANAIRKTLNELIASKKKVIYLLSIPALDFIPEDCVNIRPFSIKGTKRATCDVDRATVDQINLGYRNMVLRVLKDYPQVTVWDPYTIVCDDKTCSGVKNELSLYRDKIHLGYYGSQYIADRLPIQQLINR
jgi:peptidoglycan/LPS O-acetylase OafA/YrhL